MIASVSSEADRQADPDQAAAETGIAEGRAGDAAGYRAEHSAAFLLLGLAFLPRRIGLALLGVDGRLHREQEKRNAREQIPTHKITPNVPD